MNGMIDEICNFFEKKLSLKQLQTNHGLNPISKVELKEYIDDLKIIYYEDYKFINSINTNLI